jgi:penicillin-insensitive murein endopeptidase
MRSAALAALLALVAAAAAGAAEPSRSPPAPPPEPPLTAATFSRLRTPAPGPARAIGGYSAGCIQGAVALPLVGDGFRVVHPERQRVFGHPTLIALLRQLGEELLRLRLAPLAVGDLSQARGGPAPSGHASHQTGLDVDVWFVAPAGNQTVSMVDEARAQPSPRFTAAMARLLELTASDARVDRVFVNPVLKRAMCARAVAAHEWLRKLRPWWGHDDHFHVRLACPADSPACAAQAPLPPGDGCDALAWWFDTHAQEERARKHQSYSAQVGASPALPAECRALVAAP